MTAPRRAASLGRGFRCALCSFVARWPGELDHHQRIWHNVGIEPRRTDMERERPAPEFKQERLFP